MATINWKLLNRLNSKVERAEKHIVDLCVEWDKFKLEAYQYRADDEISSGETIWILERARPIPDSFSLMAGDAIHSLRCALDHLVYRLAEVHCRKPPITDGLYFPTGKDLNTFTRSLGQTAEHKSKRSGVVIRLRQDVVEAIRATEPYEGGKGAILRHIHCLDVVDKHRSLVTAATSIPTASMSPDKIAAYRQSLGIAEQFTPEQEASIFQTECSAPFPLSQGDILHRSPTSKANKNMKFIIQIAFLEPTALKGKPIYSVLYQASHRIRDIIRSFYERGFLS